MLKGEARLFADAWLGGEVDFNLEGRLVYMDRTFEG
jgi:hypothetical protein